MTARRLVTILGIVLFIRFIRNPPDLCARSIFRRYTKKGTKRAI